MNNITRTGATRMMKGAGAQRVSVGATSILTDAVEDYAAHVSAKAIALAEHAGRKTVLEKDVKLALKG